jgi:hypothetical protein
VCGADQLIWKHVASPLSVLDFLSRISGTMFRSSFLCQICLSIDWNAILRSASDSTPKWHPHHPHQQSVVDSSDLSCNLCKLVFEGVQISKHLGRYSNNTECPVEIRGHFLRADRLYAITIAKMRKSFVDNGNKKVLCSTGPSLILHVSASCGKKTTSLP